MFKTIITNLLSIHKPRVNDGVDYLITTFILGVMVGMAIVWQLF